MIPVYTDEQLALIRQSLAANRDIAARHPGWCEVSEGHIRVADGHLVADFGWRRDLLRDEDTDEITIKPVVLNGMAYRFDPEEGRAGVLHLVYLKSRRRWTAPWIITLSEPRS